MIKGNRLGVTLVLDAEMPYPKLCDRIRMKFKESAKFFDKSSQMAITFSGRMLSDEEQAHIIDIIYDACGLEISYILEEDELKEQLMAAQIAKQQEAQPEKDMETEQVAEKA